MPGIELASSLVYLSEKWHLLIDFDDYAGWFPVGGLHLAGLTEWWLVTTLSGDLLGFTYERSDKECCRTCKQTSCVLNGTEEIVRIMPGESWYPPGDKCTYYKCDENNFTLIKKIISCPKQKIRKCKKGALIEVESADKCCKRKVCTTGTRECNVKIQKKIIRLGDCFAIVPVPYCKGSCNKSSRSSSSSSEEMKYKCSRCEAKKSQERKIKLACENGRRESYTYSHVEECQCRACTPSNSYYYKL
ncbi:intestinal mucin-like protein [Bombina bombina]|uniref:intestinal mucin-like protein n=1 Tax=Bombina bombina TaxID=8345 RepID=UPI00235AC482|nr:intestinal mucin-like protein [Bombina bombina]